MVCNRCKMVVKAELEKLGLTPLSVDLGEVSIKENPSTEEKLQIDARLSTFGFKLLEDKKAQITGQIKSAIVDLVHYNPQPLKVNLSAFLSEKLNLEYNALTSAFSETEEQTIEKYFIAQKVERVKEMITYGELNLSEIAYQLNYSSVAHLSSQFKKVTGVTPSQYKAKTIETRKTLDEI
ncbi:helix-turn-helix domain-containing protein [Pedobacter sp. AW1-32]|uniref:helix-turn-helix domain-containing protein n=1 Tax=Pedobacter sp. AW1-32 TaxID=3383026 RepID=UPI003FEF5FC7